MSRLPAQLPVVALVDLKMPGMDGSEIVHRLRKVRAGSRVVLMSGHSPDHLEQAAAALLPTAALGKPFHVSDLQRIVAQLRAPAERVAKPTAVASSPS